MKQVIIARDVYAPDTWTRESVDDVLDYLESELDLWPETARIYHNYIAQEHDVTPCDQFTLDRMRGLDGIFYVVIYPADPITATVAAIFLIAKAVELLMPMPKIPTIDQQNQRNSSPNNELSNRTNRPRVNARIPDIFGTVRSTPDLIALPYTVYENNVEVEYMLACIGRGQYDIKDVYDGETRLADIAGASAQLYELDEDIVVGTPFQQYGDPITDQPYQVIKSNAVNGQILRPANSDSVGGSGDIAFRFPNEIIFPPASDRDFTNVFKAGDTLTITGANFVYLDDHDDDPMTDPIEVDADLNGTYTILGVSAKLITLSSPAAVNPNWAELDQLDDDTTPYGSPLLVTEAEKWVGSFVLEDAARTHLIFNFVAQNGIFKDNGEAQYSYHVNIEIEVTPIDENDDPTGTPETYPVQMVGSSVARDTIGHTEFVETGFVGRCRVRVRRSSETDKHFKGNVVDEVKWRDLYGAQELQRTQYGDTTIVRARTYATAGALSVKERKLNFLVQRKLPTFNALTGEMTTERYPTNSAADAIASVCFDQSIGRRIAAEVDLEGIYQTIADVAAYFGTTDAAEFCYTFDNSNQSFEEIVNTIAQTVFCEAYRQGNQIKLHFEALNDDSVLLFNHRNKVPRTEKRTISFGIENRHDGVEYLWTDPKDDAKVTLRVPTSFIVNPKKVESVGVRNKRQAHFAAWRIWNKLKYQRETIEFEAMQESDLLVRQDRILVADNTRTGTQDGEIETQTGLIVTTSQPCAFDPLKTYTMHLQLYDGSVDAIGCSAGADAYSVVLDRAPLLPLVLEHDRYVRTAYMLVANSDSRPKAFLVGEKSTASRNTNKLNCVNYDARYYDNDSDFAEGVIP
ncbi:MAG: host specificity factor TipJ family phage tail protein [Pseudomonadota bacterium]|nr:host specificity factor TipJ family phage tail protein [Pseudomonadota bacterium]